VFASRTNVYSPYLARSDEASDPSQDELIPGQDYQEVLTNFPFGSQILTGVFLDINTSGPGSPTETFERALLDRLGFAARQAGPAGPPTGVRSYPNGPPAFTSFDVFTIHALPGLQDPRPAVRLQPLIADLSQQLTAAQGQGPASQAQGFPARNLLAAQTITAG